MRNQAPLPRAAHYITPPGRSQATSTRASPSPPMRDPISRSEHRTPEPQQSNRPATTCASSSGTTTSRTCGSGLDWRTPYGLAFECVEFVRRFYGRVYPLLQMPCCGNASEFTPSTCSEDLSTLNGSFSWSQNGPGGAPTIPMPDDIVVFTGSTYGHVAIVREVTASAVYVVS